MSTPRIAAKCKAETIPASGTAGALFTAERPALAPSQHQAEEEFEDQEHPKPKRRMTFRLPDDAEE